MKECRESLFGGSLGPDMGTVPDRPSNQSVIQACTLLNGLDESHRERLIDCSHMAYAERGETIWIAGQSSEFSGVVGVGFVKMTRSSPHGAEVAVELLGPGQCFGLMAAIEGREYPLTASAVTNCWYLKLPTREVQAIYSKSEAMKDQIVRSIGPRLRRAHEMMSRLSSGSVEERIAAVLFILAGSYGRSTSDGLTIEVPLTRSDISEMAGTTTETTIRVMSRWQKQGLVTTDKHVVTIRDEVALNRLLRAA
jgi:CRP-like cAMP-binding protein